MELLMPLVAVVLVAGPVTSAPTWGGLEAVWMLRMAYAEIPEWELPQTPPTRPPNVSVAFTTADKNRIFGIPYISIIWNDSSLFVGFRI